MRPRTAIRRSIGFVVAFVVGGSLAITAVATPASAADPCAVGGNPIVCENSKPGADPSEWEIEGAGSDDIQGFSTDISVNAGATIGFKIKTAASAYTIDIYRTGYYDGLGARKVASVTPSATLPQHQPVCVTDVTTELYDCGNWALSASWAVPATAVSGVYFAHLVIAGTGADSHITFVVRNDASHSPIVFQTSDPTWQAYNTYGGSDFYQGAANGRAYKLSYNRPVVTRGDNDGRDFYFSAEYPMVRFLERNGYDVSYISGVDTDRSGSLLLNHKTFLSVGHDEYWSTGQRANVEAARDAGVNLAFFSGNEAYWHTRYESSVAGTATAYRTLVSYKETWGDAKIDPSSTWTGTWRDPRFASPANGGGRPENGLTGTEFMSNVSDMPVTVSAEEGKLRIWRNTSLTSLAPGAVQELAPHTVGYESDEASDNVARPAGLIKMSTSVGNVLAYLMDFGSTTGPATTTHNITLYRAASGALVFSAGSIQWSWGLDSEHDGSGAAADSRMQQATVNLLADMSAQPATLEAGLVAAAATSDHTGPTVTITSPASGATIANGTQVTVTGTASDVGGRVAGVEVSTDGGVRWHPATGTATWSYSYVQSGLNATTTRVRAVDDSANIGPVATRPLTVTCPCSIFGSAVPKEPAANDGAGYELGLVFKPTTNGYVTGVRFYKGAGNTGTHRGTLWSASGAQLASVTFVNETATGWQTAAFASPVAVTAGAQYTVSYTAPNGHYATENGAFWYEGRATPPLTVSGGFGASGSGTYGAPGSLPTATYSASHYYVDVTFGLSDTTPLTLIGQTPLAGASSVAVASPISARLSKPATGASLSVKTQAGVPVAGTSAYDSATQTVSFTPSGVLATSTTYVVTAAAAGLTGTTTWSFVTAAAPQVPGARVVSLYDDSATPGTLQVPDDQGSVTLGVRFASGADGVVNGVRFYKGPGNVGTHVGALWAVGGTQPIAQATFTNESTTGWQTVTFASPVRIAKDAEYIASYRTTAGNYSATVNAFSGVGVQRPPLRTAPDSGQYSYPDANPSGRSSTSYLVDVVFTADAPPLAAVTQTPADGDPGAATSSPVSLTLTAPLAAGYSLVVKAGTQTVAGSTALSGAGTVLTFTPSAALAAATQYTAVASGLVSTDGVTAPPITWTFTTAAPTGCPCTMFASRTPATAAANDNAAVTLGVSFTPTTTGSITGVRFYKGAGNGGTHTGTLWSASGQQLRTVTFVGETATGWQTATFATPYEVAAGTTYVVSYLAPQGRYAVTSNDFTVDRTFGPLTVPAAGNGRYVYGSGFPTNTWQQTNYFVDVVFTNGPPPPPVVVSTSPSAGATGISRATAVTAVLSKAPTSGTPVMTLTGASGAIGGTSTFNAGTLTVTFTPSAQLDAGATVSASVAIGGTVLGSGAWSFSTASGTPTAVSLWADTDVPANESWDDFAGVQVGTRFTASTAGTVTAIRFYKGAANTGAHTVNLWSPTGVLLGSAPSTGETASGWQTVNLSTPIAITAGQTYTAAYYSTTGRYAVTPAGLESPRVNGPLSTLATGGAYLYGTGFPGNTSTASYGVDLVFVPAG